MNYQNLYDEFENAVATMNMPALRKLGNYANAMWFLRNGRIENKCHGNFMHAHALAMKIAKVQ